MKNIEEKFKYWFNLELTKSYPEKDECFIAGYETAKSEYEAKLEAAIEVIKNAISVIQDFSSSNECSEFNIACREFLKSQSEIPK